MQYVVYKLISPSGKMYIGCTNNLDGRVAQHLRELIDKDHCNRYLQEEWDKNSEGEWRCEVVKECKSRNEALGVEDKTIEEAYKENCELVLNIQNVAWLNRLPEFMDKRKQGYQKQSETLKKRYKDSQLASKRRALSNIKRKNKLYLIIDLEGNKFVTDSYVCFAKEFPKYSSAGFKGVLDGKHNYHIGATIKELVAPNKITDATYILFTEKIKQEIEEIESGST